MRITMLLIAMPIIVVAIGCGGDGKVKVYPVQGKLLDDTGKPVNGATVIFHATQAATDNNQLSVIAKTDETGSFSVTTYSTGDGAPAGEYIITVIWLPEKKSLFDAQPDKLQGRYADKSTSKLKCVVESKPLNELPPMMLK